MMENFNSNMYDHVRAAAVPRPRNERQADEHEEEEGEEAEDLVEILNDVKELPCISYPVICCDNVVVSYLFVTVLSLIKLLISIIVSF